MTLEFIGASVSARLCESSLNQPQTYKLETTTISLVYYSIGHPTAPVLAILADVSQLSCVGCYNQPVASGSGRASLHV